MKYILFVFCQCLLMAVLANDTVPRSVRREPDILEKGFGIAFALDVQPRVAANVGLSKNYFVGSGGNVVSYDIYAMGSYFPKFTNKQNAVYGAKLGAMTFGLLVGLGVEFQLLYSGSQRDFIFTPRAGLGLGMAHITYGHNISANDFPIRGINRNIVSIHYNWNVISKKSIDRKNRTR